MMFEWGTDTLLFLSNGESYQHSEGNTDLGGLSYCLDLPVFTSDYKESLAWLYFNFVTPAAPPKHGPPNFLNNTQPG